MPNYITKSDNALVTKPDLLDRKPRYSRVIGSNPQPEEEEDLDSGVLGMVPFLGDALSIGLIAKDTYLGNFGKAALGAGMLLVPNFLEKPAKMIGKPIYKAVTKGGKRERKLIPVKAENDVPVYSEKDLDDLDLELKLGKSGKGGSFNENDGLSDITQGNMNVAGVTIPGGRTGARDFIYLKFNEAPHGQIVSFSGHFPKIDLPLSTDSYNLALKFLSEMEAAGKGKFIKNPYPEKFTLNTAGNHNGVEFYPLMKKQIERTNKKYNKLFNVPELHYKEKKNPFKPGHPLYETFEKTGKAAHYYTGDPVTFIKYKQGGNI